MYVQATDTTTGLQNSATPMSQGRINAQNARVARKGAIFTNGNQDMAAIIAALTPPAPTSSCDNLTSSLALRGPVNPFPAPSPYSSAAAAAASPTIIAPPMLATPSSVSTSSPGSSSVLTSGAVTSNPVSAPGSNGNGWPGGGCFGLGSAPRRFRRGRPRGFGDYADEVYHGGIPVTLQDGTVIADPAHTTPTRAQCLPYFCWADQGQNLAARYWCTFSGFDDTYNPCSNPACAPWKAASGVPCPVTATTAEPAPTPAPAPVPAGLYPQAPVLGAGAPTFPGFPCNSAAAAAARQAASEGGSANCWLQVGIGAAALTAIIWLFNKKGQA
jgi:hypothetical protein